eukprot:TRINITY_DN22177_c0_g1_i3.p1 TRINITY_DN22177_c0_g1~~TRINITY_DN22177_c0_g1_i3.p1  ORF type:complete len:899 (+),score=189.80 TRINITY_DN22177_c0_g1_i3:385-3081(+)
MASSTASLRYTEKTSNAKYRKITIKLRANSRCVALTEDGAPGDAVKHKDKACAFVLDPNPALGKDRPLYYFDAPDEANLHMWLDGLSKVIDDLANVKRVVCIPGLASTSLETRREGEQWKTTYCSIKQIATGPSELLERMTLRQTEGSLADGTAVVSSECAEGVEVRAYAGTDGFRTLNPGEITPIPVWRGLVDALAKHNDLNLVAFGYDWRRWGDPVFAEQIVERFKCTFEDIAEQGCPKPAIIAHSMGCFVALYCMSVLGDEWSMAHIDQFIMVAPAPCGCPKMMPSWSHGVVNPVDGDGMEDSVALLPGMKRLKQPLMPLHDAVCAMTESWPAMIAEMPMPVGEVKPWAEDFVIASTPEKNYTLDNMGEFLEDVAAATGARGLGPALWPHVLELSRKMAAPAIDTRIIYGDGVDTMAQLDFEAGDLAAPPKVKSYEPGDGTILASCIEKIADAWSEQGKAEVKLFPCPNKHIDHQHLIECVYSQNMIRKMLRREELDDVGPTKAVVCMAGLASTALEVRKGGGSWKVAYCSICSILRGPRTLLERLKLRQVEGTLKDGSSVVSTANLEGVEVRPFEGSRGIQTLNPGEYVPIAVWEDLLQVLEERYNVFCLNYDWRRWGDPVFAEQLVDKFKEQFEDIYNENGTPTAIIAHSMGCFVALYCMSELGEEWTKKYVDQLIMVGPAPCGCPKMMACWTAGVITPAEGDTSSSFPGSSYLEPLDSRLAGTTSTWPAMLAEMPSCVSGVALWPSDYPIATTPEKTYNIGNIKEFIEDVAAAVPGRDFGPAFWPAIEQMQEKMKTPVVDVRIIYGANIDTIAQLEYPSANLSEMPKVKTFEGGDGTILASCIEALAEGWKAEGLANVSTYKGPEEVDHQHLISCPFTQELIPKLIDRTEDV